MRSRLASIIASALVACACGTEPSGSRVDEVTTHPGAPPIAPFEECTVYTAREPALSASHVTSCSEIDRPAYPPASGDHYPSWAAFRTYDAAVPWGFLVHSLEHGAIVLAYRCEGLPSDPECTAITDALAAIVEAHGADPVCRGEVAPSRFVIVPDPDLEWPIAAVAWEHVYLATCVDEASLSSFVRDHYARSPENICFAGVDRSDTGWCD